jgi:hypothetical protein
LSRGEDIAAVDVTDPAADDELAALADSSSVPVTSTLRPTCGDNLESSASSRYWVPAVARDGLVDELDDELDDELELLPGLVVRVLDVDSLDTVVTFIKR